MISLYKKTGNKILFWGAVELSRRKGYIITAVVGEPEGQPEEIKTGLFSSFAKEMIPKVEELKAQGYAEEMEDVTLMIVYPYELSPEQRDTLETGLDEFLSDRNLGFTDSSLSEYSVPCLVINYELALKHIKTYLASTPFHNYKEIYNLDDVPDEEEEEEEEEEDDDTL